jgi:hypothetical protein
MRERERERERERGGDSDLLHCQSLCKIQLIISDSKKVRVKNKERRGRMVVKWE